MSEASTHGVTVNDIDQLVTGATPQFSMQILERVKALVLPLPEGDEIRAYGELQMQVLERIATGTTRGTRALGAPGEDNDGWDSIPSHPKGGIAPGHVDSGH
ncbi:MAG: hypothetical protein JWL76_1106 [Thermoleophilia bacterium]|nr:hypothetical protein [Thermoleophilia bacterium]